jgi:hypothetical protein
MIICKTKNVINNVEHAAHMLSGAEIFVKQLYLQYQATLRPVHVRRGEGTFSLKQQVMIDLQSKGAKRRIVEH